MATVQFSSTFYLTFILVLVLLFLFGIIYAYLIRKAAKNDVQGQTASSVVVGVFVTVLAASALIGWQNTLYLLACFAASGIPMIFEYNNRLHNEQKRDREDAADIAKDLLG